MANIKFSAFDAGGSADSATARVVGFKNGDTTANYYYTIADLTTMIGGSVSTLYTANGALTAARTVTMGAYNLEFASTTKDQQVSFGQNVKISGQGYTELHANATNLTVSWQDSNIQTVEITGVSPTFAPTAPKAGATYILIITQGATPVTVNWNSLVKWPAGTAPTLSSVTGKIDVITLICYDDSTTNGLYYGSATLDLA